VAVLVPFHRSELTADEEISLRHARRFLAAYDRFAVAPASLEGGLDGFETERFPDRHFTSAAAFSRLQLDAGLYRRFGGYDFVLLYQLDALVLSDQLLEFCTGRFDYIGAPWIDVPWLDRPAVGNGGLSLRSVSGCLRVLEDRRYRLGGPSWHWRALSPLPRRLDRFRRGGNQDLFWSFDAPRRHPGFRVAPVEEGLRFAFELEPRRCFELNHGQLPFGCHAWARHDRAFWEPHLLT